MRLYTIFLILIIQLNHILAFPPSPFEITSQTSQGQNGYECGNVFFSDVEVKKVLTLAMKSMDKGYSFPQRYRGKLYSESMSQEYLIYPIRKGSLFHPHVKYPNSVFRVVFTRDSKKEIDVIAKILSNDYTLCTRRHSTNIESSNLGPEIPNGYLCAHEFFSNEIILKSLARVLTKGEGNTKYPSPYVGNLYPDFKGLLLWPITSGKKKYISATTNIGPYFLILNEEKHFVDMVVRGYSNNFLRCIRLRNPPNEPASESHNKLFVPPPKTGFSCGRHFFDDVILEKNAETVKNQLGPAIKAQFLEESYGPPCYQPCYLMPLFKDGSLSMIGRDGMTRLILSPDFKVMGVALHVRGTLKKCDRKTINAERNHDTSDFHCNDQVFSHEQLLIAAEEACVKMNSAKKVYYPAKYEGPGFNIDGPYLTFPVFENGVFGRPRRSVGPHRVVINLNCEIVGALTRIDVKTTEDLDDKSHKSLVKCHRLDDGPLPSWFFGPNSETASESYGKN